MREQGEEDTRGQLTQIHSKLQRKSNARLPQKPKEQKHIKTSFLKAQKNSLNFVVNGSVFRFLVMHICLCLYSTYM